MELNYKIENLEKMKIDMGQIMPLAHSCISDAHTPISIYAQLKSGYEYSFLLESAEHGEKIGRYSFLGFGARKHISFSECEASIQEGGKVKKMKTNNPLEFLKKQAECEKYLPDKNLPPLQAGFVGYLSYDCVQYFDNIKLPKAKNSALPEMQFIIPEVLVVFDNYKHRMQIISYLHYTGNLKQDFDEAKKSIEKLKSKLEAASKQKIISVSNRTVYGNNDKTMSEYEKSVKESLKRIKLGEVFQVVLSQEFEAETDQSSLDIYRRMRDINPSPYLYLLDFKDMAIIGSSPETLVKVEGENVLVKPIAGTRRRGETQKEDQALAKELLSDEKELAEHRMLVDLARNDVGRVARQGKVEVKNYIKIQKYSHVMHMVTDVEGKLATKKDSFDAFKACFPAGTLSGAPKIRAMEIISELEQTRRGIYGGAIGYFDFSGNMDFAIAIRTIIKKGKKVCVQAGAGIVFDSIPEKEFQECVNKAASSLACL